MAVAAGDWDECIDRLYDAVGNEGSLTQALGRFRPFFDARSVTFLTAPQGDSQASIHVAACDVPPEALVEYHSHYFRHDEWVKAGWIKGVMHAGSVYRGSDLVPRRSLFQSYFWRDFLRRFNITDILGAIVDEPSDTGPAALVTFHRTLDQRPYEARMVGAVSKLAPHLRRAWHLHRRLAPEIAVGTTLSELLHAMDVPMLFVSREGTVVERNMAATSILKTKSALLKIERERLLYCDGRQWRPVAAELGRFENCSLPVFELRAHDEASGTAATVTLRRMHGAFTDRLIQHASAAVCTVSPVTTDKLHSAQQRFGLTDAELQVARLIARGRSAGAAAQELGVAVSTVRTHLSALFGKTGTQRQAELVALLLVGDVAGS